MLDAPGCRYEVVVLAGGECKRLYPLTSGGAVKALLPVGGRPLIYYTLRHLAEAGIKTATVVAIGEAAAGRIGAWLASGAAPPVTCRVLAVGDDLDTGDALRAAAPRLDPAAAGVVVYSGDLVCDAPLGAIALSHALSGALATVLVSKRRGGPPSAETKPGKAPKGVDYLGLDPTKKLLLFSASHPDALRDLRVPLAAVARFGAVEVRSDLSDCHLYVLSRQALELLVAKPSLSSLKLDLLPALCRAQLASGGGTAALLMRASSLASRAASPAVPVPAAADGATPGDARGGDGGDGGNGGGGAGILAADELPGADYMRLVHGGGSGAAGGGAAVGRVAVYMAPEGGFCERVNTLQAYGDVNRDVAAPDVALHLTGMAPSRHDNVLAPTVTLGNKATVGPACIVGDGTALADKASVKRSVIGAGCRLGAGAKVINSVLHDGVSVGDGAHVQNSVLCAGAGVGAGAALKDCYVGAGYAVQAQADHRGETLARA